MTTTIFVEPQKVSEAFVRSSVKQEVGYQINSLRHRVIGYTNLNQLIEKLGANRFDPEAKSTREQLMKEIRDSLSFEIDQRSNGSPVFEIAYASADPELAADVAREVAELFISENIKDRTRQAESTSEFLDRELDRIRAEVSEQEKQLGIFRSERMGSLPEQLDTNLRALDRTPRSPRAHASTRGTAAFPRAGPGEEAQCANARVRWRRGCPG